MEHQGDHGPKTQPLAEGPSIVRHEEQLHAGTRHNERKVRAHKRVESEQVEESIPREREDVSVERVPATSEDSGEIETLPDGSISIPLYEEELVVTKRRVLRERVLIKKETHTEQVTVQADLLRERAEIESEDRR
jgi:uncharacterized protein (TIGR02271 family)